ncbi:hypothetical protein TSH58p_03690 [Azospirillum sp. TSH58]|uniref:DUF1653 domain-containing protein n=1 Tax=Azospirillum sp. TSH58 TaxID=664962 RepID=UPI000D6017E7|nr:hypothetical protein [Azospirillum sp. TSH58]AWJ82699.1 hypothetical protein TSH58p_03690 [Azospirillum sp. TSH58]PWC69500.1 hypothetical protein TSH58_15325 [Azospirillum sp. TSH58]
MKTDPQNTMILSEVRGESAPGEPPQDTHALMVSRSPADVLDLQGRCAVLAETGGDGAVEAGVIGDMFDWLFGISDVDPLAGYGESGEEGDSKQAVASGSNLPSNGDVAGRLKLLEDAFTTTVMTGNGMIALAKSLGASLKQAEADRDALRNETVNLCEVVNRLVSQACAAHAREGALHDILRFDPTAFPAMETAAVECAGKLSIDPVSLLEACEAIAAAALGSDMPGLNWKPTHRHRKGGEYRVIARGELESDLTAVVVYESQEGRVWVHPASEFDDGRFTAISTSTGEAH